MAELQQAILLTTELLLKLAQPNDTEKTLESLATNISEFSFDPENGINFEKWYSRNTDLFESDAKNLDDSAKLVKCEAEDIITYGAKVSRSSEDLDFKNMNIDQFKCLVFVSGLKGPTPTRDQGFFLELNVKQKKLS
uniref:DUF7083 domain-containing protein n=1 Tax=Anopheles quadriannulatus TaxID=34691 RepID=A0A182XPS2_ANOQN